MARITFALGAFVLINGSLAVGQQTGTWKSSRPGSKAIVYDEKGRRLFWDNNGQIIGRYSFATGKYIAELPGKQREEKIDPTPKSPGENPRNLAIIYWGRGRDETLTPRAGPKIISGPAINRPTIVRHGEKPLGEGITAVPSAKSPSAVSIGPEEMPYYTIY